MKIFALLLAVLAFSPLAFAHEGSVGNGGDGIVLNDKLYLLDFAEFLKDRRPYFHRETKVRPEIAARVEQIFGSSELGVDTNLLSHKLSEVADQSRVTALALLRTMELYRWAMVDYNLPNVPDENALIDGPLRQLAIRLSSSIVINRANWLELDAENRVGLIFHEAVFALLRPVGANGLKVQRSIAAREIIGHLFGPNLQLSGLKGLQKTAGRFLPVHDGIYIQEDHNSIFSTRTRFFSPLTTNSKGEAYRINWEEIPLDVDPTAAIARNCTFNRYNFFFSRDTSNISGVRVTFEADSYLSPEGPMDYVAWDASPTSIYLEPVAAEFERRYESLGESPSRTCVDLVTKEIEHTKRELAK